MGVVEWCVAWQGEGASTVFLQANLLQASIGA